VNLVRTRGSTAPKVTGGGSGGAVAILGRADADDAVTAIAGRYQKSQTRTYVFAVIAGHIARPYKNS